MLSLLLVLATLNAAHAVDLPTPKDVFSEDAAPPKVDDNEPIQYFQRYKPSYFLLGHPITKVQISLKVQILRELPLYMGYSQLMMWDLFKNSAPFRDINFNPELFYRIHLEGERGMVRDLDLAPFEHESNGKDGPDSRSWNRIYARYTSNFLLPGRGIWWSFKLQLPFAYRDNPDLPKQRGIYEFQVGVSDLFRRFFDVNELILRIYGGGRTRVNPLQGGQELTYREKESRRIFLLTLYLQIFHGYGENLLDAGDKRWGFRAGVGF